MWLAQVSYDTWASQNFKIFKLYSTVHFLIFTMKHPIVHKSGKILYTCSIVIIVSCILLAGCLVFTRYSRPHPMLQISLVANPDCESHANTFTTTRLSGNIRDNIRFGPGISDVKIKVGKKYISLIDALESELISMDKILYCARQDAASGFCEETFSSEKSLANYVYHYPEFDLRLIDDIFESPSGPLRHIQHIGIFRPNEAGKTVVGFLDSTIGNGWTTREDWGLQIKIGKATPTGVQILFNQSGGQQLGDLRLISYSISAQPPVEDFETYEACMAEIAHNGQTKIDLTWDRALPPGDYCLKMQIEDVYDRFSPEYSRFYRHPLMRNFWDIQYYEINFTLS